jgi:hypothetical protein
MALVRPCLQTPEAFTAYLFPLTPKVKLPRMNLSVTVRECAPRCNLNGMDCEELSHSLRDQLFASRIHGGVRHSRIAGSGQGSQ